MPGYDRTGPMGAGPMSGWGQGYCGGNAAVGTRAAWGGRGFGRGFGRGAGCGYGRGFRRGGYGAGRFSPYAPGFPEDELAMLRSEAELMKRSLDAVNRRISQIESTGPEKPEDL